MGKSKISPAQLGSLALMVAAIVIGWIAYHNYQPKLLTTYGLEHLAFFLVVAQGIILFVTPPIAGALADRMRDRQGHRFRIISLGVGFAAMVFMTVAFGLSVLPQNTVAFLLPLLVILWLVAMNIFTSPAISTFELFAPFERQPVVLAILALTAELLYALEPIIVPLIDQLGPAPTFLTGGILVTIAGIALRRSSLHVNETEVKATSAKTTQYPEVFITGVRLGIPTAMIFNLLPDVLPKRLESLFPELGGDWMVSGLLAVAALVALPMGRWSVRLGAQASQRYGFFIGLVAMLALFAQLPAWLTLIAAVTFAAVFSLQSIGALPHALANISYERRILGVGVFFAGIELPNALLEIYLAM